MSGVSFLCLQLVNPSRISRVAQHSHPLSCLHQHPANHHPLSRLGQELLGKVGSVTCWSGVLPVISSYNKICDFVSGFPRDILHIFSTAATFSFVLNAVKLRLYFHSKRSGLFPFSQFRYLHSIPTIYVIMDGKTSKLAPPDPGLNTQNVEISIKDKFCTFILSSLYK